MRWIIRYAALAAFVVAGVVVAFDSSSLADRGWWQPPDNLVFACIITLGVYAVLQFTETEIDRRRFRRRHEIANEVSQLLFPTWDRVHAAGKSKRLSQRMGVHVWMVPSWHWQLVPELIRKLTPRIIRDRLRTPNMWRAAIFRLEDDGHDSTDIQWRRDIGAIGKCWRTRSHVYFCTDSWGEEELGAKAWAEKSVDETLGLTHEQYLRVWRKYHSVLVWPIYKNAHNPGSRLIGCIVFDTLKGHPVDLDVAKIRSEATSAAVQVSRRLVPIGS